MAEILARPDTMSSSRPLSLMILSNFVPEIEVTSQEELAQGQRALHILCEALLGRGYRKAVSPELVDLELHYSTSNSVTLGIIPLDFYAWNLWKPDERIAVCVAGTPSDKTFHSLARGRFREYADQITIERGDKSEGTFNLQISAIKIHVTYHQNPVISQWESVKQADIVATKKVLPWLSQDRLGKLERTQEVARQLFLKMNPIITATHHSWQDLDVGQICSERNKVMETCFNQQGGETVRKAYFMYRQFAKHIGAYPGILKREHILALALYGLNIEHNENEVVVHNLHVPMTRDKIDQIGEEFSISEHKMREQTWNDFQNTIRRGFGRRLSYDSKMMYLVPHWPAFLNRYAHFIRIDVSFWGSSRISAAKWFHAVENAIRSGVLRELRKYVIEAEDGAAFQFWPTPFVQRDDQPWSKYLKNDEQSYDHATISQALWKSWGPLADCVEDYLPGWSTMVAAALRRKPEIETAEVAKTNSHFELSYFIGTSMFVKQSKLGWLHRNIVEKPRIENAFLGAFDFEDTCTHSECSVENHEERDATGVLTNLPPRKDIFYPFTPYVVAMPEDTRKLALDDVDDTPSDQVVATQSSVNTRGKKGGAKESGSKNEVPTSLHPSAPLRRATDVLHRIRHDGTYNSEDFLIGYLDRHAGIKEIPFDWWTSEATAEEFIPQSRIRYFKRKTDSVVVWDREKRIDLVFGTGKHE